MKKQWKLLQIDEQSTKINENPWNINENQINPPFNLPVTVFFF